MSEIKVDNKVIRQVARDVDKAGNNNKVIDGSEVSIFADKLEAKGVTNAKSIISSYNSNRLYYENLFSQNGATSDNSPEYEIYAQLNNNSFLKSNKSNKKDAKMIAEGIRDAVNGWFFGGGTDDTKLKRMVDTITKDNVLAVLDESYDEDETLMHSIIDDVDQDDMDDYGKTIITALVDAAMARSIDVSDIVSMDENGNYTVGNGVSGAKFGESATDKDYVEAVVNALKERIETSMDTITNPDKAKEDPKTALSLLARQVDSAANGGNGNGQLDGEEVASFKALCSKLGIIVNDILSSISNKTKESGSLTDEEQAVKDLFSGEANFNTVAEESKIIADTTAGIYQSIEDEDEDKLKKYLTSETINADNVEKILSELDKKDGYNGKIGEKFDDAFGDDAESYLNIIISALYSKAEKENVDVSDIVRPSKNTFVTPDGENALDSDYANKVISDLRSRIKDELGE